jgi:hypothetical protein
VAADLIAAEMITAVIIASLPDEQRARYLTELEEYASELQARGHHRGQRRNTE